MKYNYEELLKDHDRLIAVIGAIYIIVVFGAFHQNENRERMAKLEAQVAANQVQMTNHDELNAWLIVRMGCVTLPVYSEETREACTKELADDDFGVYDEIVRAKLEAQVTALTLSVNEIGE